MHLSFIHTVVDFHTVISERKSIYLLSSVRRESFDSDCLLYKGTGGYPLRKLYSQSLSSSDQEVKHLPPSFLPFFLFSFVSLFYFLFFFFARAHRLQPRCRSAPDVGRGEEKFLPRNERRIRGDFAGIKLRSKGRRSKVSLTGQAFVAGKFPCLETRSQQNRRRLARNNRYKCRPMRETSVEPILLTNLFFIISQI